tara:strand:+ start:66 stop:293 length:228 start_codon:yes stop_codon:yes gene_type:complete
MAEDKPMKHNPQKFNWKKVTILDTFEEADKKRNDLKEKHKHLKIRRCGPDGTKFKVLVGEPIKKKTKKDEKKQRE